MARPYRFQPPSPSDWAGSWRALEAPAERAAYLESCWTFDSVLGPLVPDGHGREALEVGCFPGGFMTYLHQRFGYRVSGIDYLEDTERLAKRLIDEGVELGSVTRGDFTEIPPEPRFDVVSSFGFIEHFHDPVAILRRHVQWLAPDGWLVVEIPNFRRLQWALHRAFDDRSLRGHNVRAMDRQLIRDTLTSEGLEIVHLGFFGACGFWFEPDDRGVLRDRAARLVATVMGKCDSLLRRLPVAVSNPWSSPFLICVARRP